jgi:galactokinase
MIHTIPDSKMRFNINNYNFNTRKQNMTNALQILTKNKHFNEESTQTISYVVNNIDIKCKSFISDEIFELLL